MNLPEGWTIKARGPDADGQCWVEIISPRGDSAAFGADAGRVTGKVVAELAEAMDATPYPPATH